MTTGEFLALRGTYMALNDPTEWAFIYGAMGGFQAFDQFIRVNPEARVVMDTWREELLLKLSSEALGRILEVSKGETKDALAANKYIYEALNIKDKNKVGRPTKDAINTEAKRLVEDRDAIDNHYTRIFGP